MKRAAYTMSILFFLISFISPGQGFQGKATYFSASSLDIKMDSTQVNPEQQKRLMAMLKDQMQKEYELVFNKTESIYQEVESLEGASVGGFRISAFTGGGGPNYKNVNEQRSVIESEFFGKLFLVKDSLKKLDWKLGKESKKIGSYTCYKATAEQVITSKVLSGNANEKGEHAQDETDTVIVTAWYTPQIPVSQGPGEFWGLPGLIMEVESSGTKILCTKVVLNPKEKIEIKEPEKGDEVSAEEFAEIRDKKIKEMEEMYGGSRRGGSGGGRIKIRAN